MPHSPVTTGGVFVGLVPPKQSFKTPNWNIRHYKTVMFVQILECQAPLYKSKAPPIEDFLVLWQQRLDFNTIHEFTFIIHLLINLTHCCTLTKLTCNYTAMLVNKPKQNSIQSSTLLKLCHLYWNDWLKIQSNKSVSQNYNFAYHI